MTSYISLLDKIEVFCNAHLQIQKYKGEFREQMPNFSTMNEKYPLVFVSPLSDTETLETNQFTLEIYCVDIIQKDRVNINTILSDCHLILKDLYLYFKDGDDWTIDVIGEPSITPVNNLDLDYVAGWVMSITFEVEGYSVCAIPIEPITPVTVECECDDASYTITDDEANVLYAGSIVSGGSLVQQINDSTVTITDDSANILHSLSVNAEGTASQVISDSTAVIKNDLGTTLYTLSINAEGSAEQVIGNSTISNSDTTYTTQIQAEVNLVLPDSTINVNSTPEGSVVSVKTIDINVTDSLGTVTPDSVSIVGNTITIDVPDAPVGGSVGATLMKTGQTTSYRTGDDGDLEAGRATDFFTLASVNPFSTLDRFTDELGGQTYTNDIVIDWSTYDGSNVLGYYRIVQGVGVANWNNAIDGALALSIGTFTTGWRLPNINEMCNILNREASPCTDYAPFNHPSTAYWTSTTTSNAITSALRVGSLGGSATQTTKTTASYSYIGVRTFTVTGTTLS